MSGPISTNNFLTLIPTAHRVAVVSGSDLQTPLDSAVVAGESIIPTVQKTRRSSSTATADSTTTVESPTADVNGHTFLKLGN
ncbi:hypothetical protein A1O1_06959 [Capronia coronata CBS 617.96]|uniref:Uncharacterized protein n=1 Tax=Capronia coronata CBS 617.96 TaxID=1182541 RepID=W9XT15_9EURO|nr:uncharacterized protein A1O1_06959 [Capronia coronata CBS 617.96]EXJ83338.1 hypothetical protein A1O1_06959 [Capronia coronata CBS 617.96]